MPELPTTAPQEAEQEPGADAPAREEDAAAAELREQALERRRLALGEVRKYGDPVLRSAASPVAEFDPVLAEEVERMAAIMSAGMGVGLAANQLGLLRRILVFQAQADGPVTALVNPELEWASDRLETAEEGCLSLPGIVVDVERPLHVRVRGADPAGAQLTIEASGLEARVIQHEIDHLDGVLIIDRTVREQRKGALRALREGATYGPPEGDDDDDATDRPDPPPA